MLFEITKEKYIKNPCASLPNAYWKNSAFVKPDNIELIHQRDYLGADDADITKYFRLFHGLNDINVPKHNGFFIQTVNIETQKGVVANILSECYDTVYSEDFVSNLTKTKVFDNDLWIFAIDKNSMTPAALGIADFDNEVMEGSLEWIQVLPQKRGLGLGQLIVNELLVRLSRKGNFATVSGEIDNTTNPEALYRKCGFVGDDIWYVIRTN